MDGTKHDAQKIRLDLIPPEVIFSLGKVLTKGAEKYIDRNWEKGFRYGRVYAALQRHLNSWWSGETTDPETGYSHLWHALANLTFLIVFEIRGIGQDDRPVTDAPPEIPLQEDGDI
jgi:Domain of unknown function (DUF5664)